MDLTALIQSNPKLWIVVISLVITVFVTVISYFVTDKNIMRDIKAKQKALREEMKQYKDNPQKMMELNKKMMEDFPHQMKQSLKISVITLIPMLIVFKWLRSTYELTSLNGSWANSWIVWYIVASLIFSMILRKVFKLD